MPKHLIWDWNGTLFDDFHAVVAASNAAFAYAGGPAIDAQTHRERFRRPIKEFYSEIVGRVLEAAEFVELDRVFHEHYDSQIATCDVTADARAAMDGWPGTQSLLSMWFHDDLVPLVDRHGLTERFTRVDGLREALGGDGKHPHLMTHLEAVGVEAADAVLIGDSVDDARAAAAAGAACVLYTGGFTSPQQLRATGLPVVDTLKAAVATALRA
ncbi:MAG: HAD family hydrolase [Stackebrandtia sp.]